MSKQAWFSRIDLSSDLNDPGGALNLGYLLEFTTEEYWVIGMIMRAALDDARIASLDQLSKKILDDRVQVMNAEINQILPHARKPGEALTLLAAANPWSLHVSSPSRLAVPDQRSVRSASVEKLLEQYVSRLFVKKSVPKRQPRAAPKRASRRQISTPHREYIPAPWVLPPTYLMRPLVHS